MQGRDHIGEHESVETPRETGQRVVLDYLEDNDGTASIDELSFRLAVHDADEAGGVDVTGILDSYTTLKYVQIPALEEQGYVEYDSSDRVVSLRRDPDDRSVSGDSGERSSVEQEWALYYSIIGTAVAGVLVAHGIQMLRLSEPLLSGIVLIAALSLIGPPLHQYYHPQ